MPEAGVKPDVVTYNTLIGMLRIEGDDEAAKKVVEEMKKAKVLPDEQIKEILNYPARGEILGQPNASVNDKIAAAKAQAAVQLAKATK